MSPTPASGMRILVVEDEPNILNLLQSYLEHAGHGVVAAATGRAALAAFAANQFDLVVLDLMLPDISGEEVCRTIRRQSQLPIIMLTAKVAEESLLQGFHIGADDYLTKPFSPRELVARVAALLKRGGKSGELGSAGVTVQSSDGVFTHNKSKALICQSGTALELTATEYQLLALFLANQDRLFSRADLTRLVLGQDFTGDPRTVDAHIKNLRHKIGENPKQARYIHTVHGMGYRFGQE